MGKYDTYEITTKTGTANRPVDRTLSVLFEDGDVPSEVISAADMVLLDSETGGTGALQETLVALTQTEMYDLMVAVWTEQMASLGNDKRDYARLLEDAVGEAESA